MFSQLSAEEFAAMECVLDAAEQAYGQPKRSYQSGFPTPLADQTNTRGVEGRPPPSPGHPAAKRRLVASGHQNEGLRAVEQYGTEHRYSTAQPPAQVREHQPGAQPEQRALLSPVAPTSGDAEGHAGKQQAPSMQQAVVACEPGFWNTAQNAWTEQMPTDVSKGAGVGRWLFRQEWLQATVQPQACSDDCSNSQQPDGTLPRPCPQLHVLQPHVPPPQSQPHLHQLIRSCPQGLEEQRGVALQQQRRQYEVLSQPGRPVPAELSHPSGTPPGWHLGASGWHLGASLNRTNDKEALVTPAAVSAGRATGPTSATVYTQMVAPAVAAATVSLASAAHAGAGAAGPGALQLARQQQQQQAPCVAGPSVTQQHQPPGQQGQVRQDAHRGPQQQVQQQQHNAQPHHHQQQQQQNQKIHPLPPPHQHLGQQQQQRQWPSVSIPPHRQQQQQQQHQRLQAQGRPHAPPRTAMPLQVLCVPPLPAAALAASSRGPRQQQYQPQPQSRQQQEQSSEREPQGITPAAQPLQQQHGQAQHRQIPPLTLRSGPASCQGPQPLGQPHPENQTAGSGLCLESQCCGMQGLQELVPQQPQPRLGGHSQQHHQEPHWPQRCPQQPPVRPGEVRTQQPDAPQAQQWPAPEHGSMPSLSRGDPAVSSSGASDPCIPAPCVREKGSVSNAGGPVPFAWASAPGPCCGGSTVQPAVQSVPAGSAQATPPMGHPSGASRSCGAAPPGSGPPPVVGSSNGLQQGHLPQAQQWLPAAGPAPGRTWPQPAAPAAAPMAPPFVAGASGATAHTPDEGSSLTLGGQRATGTAAGVTDVAPLHAAAPGVIAVTNKAVTHTVPAPQVVPASASTSCATWATPMNSVGLAVTNIGPCEAQSDNKGGVATGNQTAIGPAAAASAAGSISTCIPAGALHGWSSTVVGAAAAGSCAGGSSSNNSSGGSASAVACGGTASGTVVALPSDVQGAWKGAAIMQSARPLVATNAAGNNNNPLLANCIAAGFQGSVADRPTGREGQGGTGADAASPPAPAGQAPLTASEPPVMTSTSAARPSVVGPPSCPYQNQGISGPGGGSSATSPGCGDGTSATSPGCGNGTSAGDKGAGSVSNKPETETGVGTGRRRLPASLAAAAAPPAAGPLLPPRGPAAGAGAGSNSSSSGAPGRSSQSLPSIAEVRAAKAAAAAAAAAGGGAAVRSKLPTLQFEGGIRYASTPVEVDWLCGQLAAAGPGVVGLDMEWRPQYVAGSAGNPTALLQICYTAPSPPGSGTSTGTGAVARGGAGEPPIDANAGRRCMCLLLHLIHSGVTPRLRELLEAEEPRKVGVNITGDAAKLKRDYGVELRGLSELDSLANDRVLQHIPHVTINTEYRARWSLSALTEVVLRRHLPKPNSIRCGNWEKQPLDVAQIRYAALDAYAGLAVWAALCRLPHRIKAPPPPPAAAQPHQPQQPQQQPQQQQQQKDDRPFDGSVSTSCAVAATAVPATTTTTTVPAAAAAVPPTGEVDR